MRVAGLLLSFLCGAVGVPMRMAEARHSEEAGCNCAQIIADLSASYPDPDELAKKLREDQLENDKCRCFGAFEPSNENKQCMQASPKFTMDATRRAYMTGCWCADEKTSCNAFCDATNNATIRVLSWDTAKLENVWVTTTADSELISSDPDYDAITVCKMGCTSRGVCNDKVLRPPTPAGVISADLQAKIDLQNAPPVEFVCAQEKQRCECNGEVAYGQKDGQKTIGAGGTAGATELTYAEMILTNPGYFDAKKMGGSVMCEDGANFGGDPAPEMNKQCWCLVSAVEAAAMGITTGGGGGGAGTLATLQPTTAGAGTLATPQPTMEPTVQGAKGGGFLKQKTHIGVVTMCTALEKDNCRSTELCGFHHEQDTCHLCSRAGGECATIENCGFDPAYNDCVYCPRVKEQEECERTSRGCTWIDGACGNMDHVFGN